ncbi:putative phospholipid hydroperoxide glutathione peroxidase 6, mitochondrial, partial [Dichanthelium oligosanthes]
LFSVPSPCTDQESRQAVCLRWRNITRWPTRQQPRGRVTLEKPVKRVQAEATAAARRRSPSAIKSGRIPAASPRIFPGTVPLSQSHSFLISAAYTQRLSMAAASSVHDFTVKSYLSVRNHYSGLTNSNYTELGQLYDMYKDQGFEILAFPCNQFAGQEPGTNEEIVQFVCTRFKAKYPIFDKVDVNGDDAAPIYKFLKSSKTGPFGDNIKWNFAKFLVDKQGRVAERYAPTTYPLSIQKDITKLIGSF